MHVGGHTSSYVHVHTFLVVSGNMVLEEDQIRRLQDPFFSIYIYVPRYSIRLRVISNVGSHSVSEVMSLSIAVLRGLNTCSVC